MKYTRYFAYEFTWTAKDGHVKKSQVVSTSSNAAQTLLMKTAAKTLQDVSGCRFLGAANGPIGVRAATEQKKEVVSR